MVTIVSIYFHLYLLKYGSQQHTKHVIHVQAYRKLKYSCVISLPFSILTKTMVYMLIQ